MRRNLGVENEIMKITTVFVEGESYIGGNILECFFFFFNENNEQKIHVTFYLKK